MVAFVCVSLPHYQTSNHTPFLPLIFAGFFFSSLYFVVFSFPGFHFWFPFQVHTFWGTETTLLVFPPTLPQTHKALQASWTDLAFLGLCRPLTVSDSASLPTSATFLSQDQVPLLSHKQMRVWMGTQRSCPFLAPWGEGQQGSHWLW